MDLEAQAKNAKIQAVRFFNEFKEVEKTANTALSNSISLQSELSTVQIDLKSLIESLQVNFDSGVQNIQNQINEVTNVVIQEQGTRKSETEALEQQIFAQEDQLQKNVKGKKAKKVAPDSFAGKMRQKLRDKAKENSGALGLLGVGAGLAGLGGSGNWFTNLFDRVRNFDGRPGSGLGETEEKNEEITEGINTYENNEEKPIETTKRNFFPSFGDMKEGLDALTLKPIFDQLYSNIKALLKSGNGENTENTEKKKFVKTVAFNDNEEVKEFNKEKKEIILNTLKYNPKDVVAASIKSINEGGTGIAGFNEETGKIEVMSNEDYEAHKKAVLSTKAGYQPDGGYTTYAANTAYSKSMGFDEGPKWKENPYSNNETNNEVVDGGTTVIEGGTEVVDGGTVGNNNNKRGEVRTSTSLVKSANSPVTAVKLSESNSVKELAIGA